MGWTNETLYQHFVTLLQSILDRLDERFASQERALELALDNQRIELRRATEQLDYRLEAMNKFREQLTAQAATFITRKEAIAAVVGLMGLAASAIVIVMRFF